ncbi:hypothetical protein GW17_00061319 [Ensete ventricosum]|nr:hypothetical protein GW17_00061319 [Ensete ventricosum]
MHPLRFPNSSIRAKEALARGSRAWPRPALLQGRPAAAKAPMQRSDWLRQGPLQRVIQLRPGPTRKATAKLQGQSPEGGRLQRGARKGWQPPAIHTAGAAANGLRTVARGQPVRGDRLRVRRPGDAHGGDGRRGGRPLAEWLPTSKGNCHLRRGSSDGSGAMRVKEG